MSIWYTVTVIKCLIILLWPITVGAAVMVSPTNPFETLSGLHVLVMCAISTLSGVTALTIRIDAELRALDMDRLPRPALFVSGHMMGSWLAGILGFAISQHNDFSVWWQIALVIVSSFTGAKFVEKVSDIYLKKIKENM